MTLQTPLGQNIEEIVESPDSVETLLTDGSEGPLRTQASADSMGGAPSGTLLHHSRHYAGFGFYTNYWVRSSGRHQMGADESSFTPSDTWNSRGVSGGYEYHIPTEIIGNALDNTIYGHGSFSVKDKGVLYSHGDRIDGGAGNDTIHGNAGHDWLKGGEGNDQLFGGAHNDTIEGGHGHDLLNGGADQDKLDGGEGNDRLVSGTGSDTLNGGNGDDWLIIDEMGASDQNQLTGGSGFDTFVLSSLVAPKLELDGGGNSMSFSQSVSLNGLGRMSLSALAKGANALSAGLAVGQSLLSFFNSGSTTPPSASLNWTQAQIITDFNPYEDSLILQLHPDNNKVQFKVKDVTSGGGGFYITQEINGAPAFLADVTFDMVAMQEHASRNGQGHVSTKDLAERAFDTLLRSYVLADGSSSELAIQEGEQTVGLGGLEQLGNNTMIILGAHGATTVPKKVGVTEHLSGTALNDILEGHHGATANHPDFSRAVLYGMDGDDILLGGGGTNILHGGEGTDTAFYGYATNSASRGIRVDMAATVDGAVLLHNGIREIGKPEVVDGADLDYLYAIENIVGSDLDDTIRGDQGDNLLVSGKGNDTLAGRGGRDTFLLNGGTNTIEDFTPGEDRIQIFLDAYEGLASSDDLVISHSETDGLGRIATRSGETIAILEAFDASSFEVSRDLELLDANGQGQPASGTVDSITGRSTQPEDPGSDAAPNADALLDGITGIAVLGTDTHLLAQAGVAERFLISQASGQALRIDGFDPTEDLLDLTAFRTDLLQPAFLEQPGGTLVDLGFQGQSILLNGIAAADLSQGAVLLA